MRRDSGVPYRGDDELPVKISMFRGWEAFGGGVSFIVATPRVWGYALVPVAMLLLLSCGLIALAVWGAHYFGNWVIGPDPSGWGVAGGWILKIALDLVGIAIAVLLALSLAQPLSGFALEAVSHAQELALTGNAAPKASFVANLFSTTKAVMIALTIGGALLFVLFLIGFFFPLATLVTIPLKFVVCGWMLAWDFLDYPLAMRGVGLERRFAWVGRNFGAFTLFGLTWALLVTIPGVVLLVLPMGVAGATRLVIADEEARRGHRETVDVVLPA